eukprot:3906058-Rhodomonas_salina.2
MELLANPESCHRPFRRPQTSQQTSWQAQQIALSGRHLRGTSGIGRWTIVSGRWRGNWTGPLHCARHVKKRAELEPGSCFRASSTPSTHFRSTLPSATPDANFTYPVGIPMCKDVHAMYHILLRSSF